MPVYQTMPRQSSSAVPPPPPGFTEVVSGGVPPPPPGFTEAVSEPVEEQGGLADTILRHVGLLARNLPGGVLDTLDMASQFGRMPQEIGASIGRRIMGVPEPPPEPTLGGLGDQLATAIGLPQPETAGERILSTVERGVGGTLGTLGVGGLARVPTLLERPAAQLVQAAAGSGAAGVADEADVGPLGQLVAAMAGGAAPAKIGNVTRRALGATNAPAMQDVMRNFDAAGSTPSPSQLVEGKRGLLSFLENNLSRVPGAKSVFNALGERQAQNMETAVEGATAHLSREPTPVQAGKSITRGLEDFETRSKAKAGELFDKERSAVLKAGGPDLRVNLTNTKALLDELTAADNPVAQMLVEQVISPKIKSIGSSLRKASKPELPDTMTADQFRDLISIDPKTGKMVVKGDAEWAVPYDAIKALRSRVGELVPGPESMSRSQIDRLYGALSDDIGATVENLGPEAKQAYTRAQNYYRGLSNRRRLMEASTSGKIPEDIFSRLTEPSSTKYGATELAAVMKSIPAKEKNAVAGAVLARLGGVDEFKPNKFYDNWSKMSPEAKRALFDHMAPDMRDNIDRIAEAARLVKKTTPGGKNAYWPLMLSPIWPFVELAQGSPSKAAMTAGGIAAAGGAVNLLSRGFANPVFVRWLAKGVQQKNVSPQAMLASLAQVAKNTKDKDIQKIYELVEEQVNGETSDE